MVEVRPADPLDAAALVELLAAKLSEHGLPRVGYKCRPHEEYLA